MFSKSFLRDPFTSIRLCAAALATTLVVVALTACGGGSGAAPATGGNPPGGSGTDTVVVTTPTMTVTYTAATLCASGPALTSTVSQLAANALAPNACPALPATEYSATSVVPSTSTLTLTINNLPAVFTDGVLTATGLASGGTWDVVSTATGITVTPRGGTSLNWVTSYSGNLVMNFAGAPSASKTITFTTGANPVVALTWPANITNLVEVGIVNGTVDSTKAVTVWTAMSPVAANIGNNTDWNPNLTNGNVKIVKSGEMAADINGVMRNIWRAIFFNPNVNGYCITPVNAHDGSAYSSDIRTSVTCFSSSPVYMIGVSDTSVSKNGVIYKGGGVCYLNTVTRGDESVACPF